MVKRPVTRENNNSIIIIIIIIIIIMVVVKNEVNIRVFLFSNVMTYS